MTTLKYSIRSEMRIFLGIKGKLDNLNKEER